MLLLCVFLFKDTATTEIYTYWHTLSLHDALPISRWREWLGRVEAVIFASDQPVPREILGRVVGSRCNLDMLLAELEAELAPRPYQLLRVAGGYALRTRPEHRDAIRTAFPDLEAPTLTKLEATVLMAIAYYQPVTRDQDRKSTRLTSSH